MAPTAMNMRCTCRASETGACMGERSSRERGRSLQAGGNGHPVKCDVGVQAAHGARDDFAGLDQRQIIVDAEKTQHLSDKQGELVLRIEVAERGWLVLVRLCHVSGRISADVARC